MIAESSCSLLIVVICVVPPSFFFFTSHPQLLKTAQNSAVQTQKRARCEQQMSHKMRIEVKLGKAGNIYEMRSQPLDLTRERGTVKAQLFC